MNTRVTAGVLLLATLTSWANGLDSDLTPERIVAERGGFVPEGFEYVNNRDRFLISSFADGIIYEVTSSSRLVPAITSPDLNASIGIEVDESRDTLYVADSNTRIPNVAAVLGVYNLATGEQLAMIDLEASIQDRAAD